MQPENSVFENSGVSILIEVRRVSVCIDLIIRKNAISARSVEFLKQKKFSLPQQRRAVQISYKISVQSN